jgi:hypothetical protein
MISLGGADLDADARDFLERLLFRVDPKSITKLPWLWYCEGDQVTRFDSIRPGEGCPRSRGRSPRAA